MFNVDTFNNNQLLKTVYDTYRCGKDLFPSKQQMLAEIRNKYFPQEMIDKCDNPDLIRKDLDTLDFFKENSKPYFVSSDHCLDENEFALCLESCIKMYLDHWIEDKINIDMDDEKIRIEGAKQLLIKTYPQNKHMLYFIFNILCRFGNELSLEGVCFNDEFAIYEANFLKRGIEPSDEFNAKRRKKYDGKEYQKLRQEQDIVFDFSQFYKIDNNKILCVGPQASDLLLTSEEIEVNKNLLKQFLNYQSLDKTSKTILENTDIFTFSKFYNERVYDQRTIIDLKNKTKRLECNNQILIKNCSDLENQLKHEQAKMTNLKRKAAKLFDFSLEEDDCLEKCSICLYNYSFDCKPMVNVSCGHTICSKCVESISKSEFAKCPACKCQDFKHVINYALLK